jgi:hypothetical protein
MYPELHPEMDGRSRRLKGFALSLAGSFTFMVTTLATVALSSQWSYFAIAGLSLGAVLLISMAHRSHSFGSQVLYLIAASATLAGETGMVALVFPIPLAAACAFFTLGGSLVAAKGIHDVESIASLDPFLKRRRELTLDHQAGGE